MTIYADILVITNLYLDFFLLLGVKKLLCLPTRGRRLVLGAFLGALCALTALIPHLSRPLALLFGLLAACLTTFAAFWPMKLRLYCKATVFYWAFSFLLAGFFLFMLTFFSPGNIAVLGSVVYFDLSPLLLFLFTLLAYGTFWIVQKLFPKDSSALRFCAITLVNQGQEVTLYAKTDTGNNLREPFSGLPVLVCEAQAAEKAAPDAVRSFLHTGKAEAALRLVPFEALGGGGVLPAFQPEQAFLSKTRTPLRCYVALTSRTLSAGQFNALWNPDLFPEAPLNSHNGGSP